MTAELTTIDQSGIRELIRERLDNPAQYIDKPSIIWRADIRDGIQQRVLDEVFNELNHGRASRIWYRIASVRRMPGSKGDVLHDMLSAKYVDRNNNRPYEPVHGVGGGKEDLCNNALFVIDPVMADRDFTRYPESADNYRSLINHRNWGGLKLTAGIPVVAYMCHSGEWFETPEAYPAAEQYVFKPDLEEFVEWAASGMSQSEIDFIRDTATEFPEKTADFLRKKFRSVSSELLDKLADHIIKSKQ